MLLLFNTLSRFVIAFLPKSKCLLTSRLQSLSTVILEPKKIKSETTFTFSSSICHEMLGPDVMVLVLWMLSFKPAFSLSFFTLIRKLFNPLHFLPLELFFLYIFLPPPYPFILLLFLIFCFLFCFKSFFSPSSYSSNIPNLISLTLWNIYFNNLPKACVLKIQHLALLNLMLFSISFSI